MKTLYLLLLALFLLKTSSVHLRWSGGFAGPILERVYQDPKVKEAVTGQGVRNKGELRRIIAEKVVEEIKKDSSALDRLANSAFPEGRIGRVQLTQEQKGKLLRLVVDNPNLLNRKTETSFIKLISQDSVLKNVHDEMLERRKAFQDIKEKLFPKVRSDPSVIPYFANKTKSSDPEFRRVYKLASAKIIKADPEMQKIVAKARFGFDPLFSQLSQDQRIKLLNLLNDNEQTVGIRWRSSKYLKLVVETLEKEPSLKEFYDKHKTELEAKVTSSEQRKARWLAFSKSSHLEILNNIAEGMTHYRQKTLPSAEIILTKLKEHPKTKNFFVNGKSQSQTVQNAEIIRTTTIQIIKQDRQLQKQLASDMFTRGIIGKLMNDEERIAMLKLALDHPIFFEANSKQETLKKEMVDLMKADPQLAKFYNANQKKILANML